MNFLSNNRLLQKQGKISFSWKNYFKDFLYRPITTTNYIPRFSENDYAANGWIKSDQQHDHSQTTTYDQYLIQL